MTRTNFIAPALAAILTLVASRPAAAQYEQVEQPADKGAPAIQNAFALQGPISHGDLLDLGEDDHLQYALLAGRAGGQILSGGTASGDALALQGSTANDGNILLNALGGNVGIGTGAPAFLLDVNGAANIAGNLTVGGTVFTHFVTANSPLQFQTDGVTRIYIDDNTNNGNVGVGNPPPVPPAFPLDVNGDIHTNSQLRSSIPDGTAPMVVASMTRVDNLNVDKLDGISEEEFALLAGRPGGQQLNGGTNNNDPLTLNGSATNDGDVIINPNGGNVGIMTTTPGEKLDVVGGNIRTNQQFISTIPDGTPPLVVDSMTVVTNLNADKLDGRHEDEFALLAGRPGGQVLHGGDAAGDDLVLDSTSDPMKGFVILNPTPVGPGAGSVGIGTMNPTEALEVIGCIKADCLKITAPNFVGVSPLGMVRAGTSVDVLPQVDGTAKVRASAVGTHSTMIPVNLHTSLFGTQQKLANVQVYYKVTSPNSFIAVTRARIMGPNGTFTNLAVNATQQKSTAWTSYFVTPATPVDITGPLYLNFELNYTGTNTAHDIQIGQIILTTVE